MPALSVNFTSDTSSYDLRDAVWLFWIQFAQLLFYYFSLYLPTIFSNKFSWFCFPKYNQISSLF